MTRPPGKLLHVGGLSRELDGNAVHLLGDEDLAAKAGSLGETKGKIEHVLFLLLRLSKRIVGLLVEDAAVVRNSQNMVICNKVSTRVPASSSCACGYQSLFARVQNPQNNEKKVFFIRKGGHLLAGLQIQRN